jgi:N6-adenosine-specific RNA methylase IME4
MDPPWTYNDKLKGLSGGAETHYDCINKKQLENLNIAKITADNAVLFMWSTGPMLADGTTQQVIRSWKDEKGKELFKIKTVAFVWRKMCRKSYTKPQYGMGRWTRSNYEFVILCVRGKPERNKINLRQEIIWPVGKHSAKPYIVRDLIVKIMGNQSRIELFAREKNLNDFYPPYNDYEEEYYENWEFTGYEYDGFDIRNL